MKKRAKCTFIHTYLLPSFSNAIAMRNLILRNISIITMMASIIESEITAKQICLNISQCTYRKRVLTCHFNMQEWSRGMLANDSVLKMSHVWLSCRYMLKSVWKPISEMVTLAPGFPLRVLYSQ